MIPLEIVWEGESHKFNLEDGEHSVGRSSDNDVQIAMARVSKVHAQIRIQGEKISVRDLGSRNGTEINGKPVGEAWVEVTPGSLVSFAGALMRRGSPATTAAHRLLGDHQVSASLRYNMSQGYSNAARSRLMDRSSELFELLASSDDKMAIETAACEFVAGCVPAERVVMLTDSGEATSVEASARWTKSGNPDAPLQLSSTIVGSVLRERDSVLVANPLEDPRFGGQQSIMALSLRSAMAAPLFDNQRVRGIFYVDTTDPRVRYSQADLEVLTATANAVAVKLRNMSLEEEIHTAARIQRALLPSGVKAPDGYEVDAHQMMCRAVGGDLYFVGMRPNGRALIALGDVTGKGMPAALAMSACIVSIGLLADIDTDLHMVADRLHRQLYRSLSDEQFVTLFMGELDLKSGMMTYINAGHEPPIIVHHDGSMKMIESTTMPFAMIEQIPLEISELTLQPGDTMAIFSDGIPEATTSGDKFLGLQGVKEILVTHRNEPLSAIRDHIVKTVEGFLAGGPASDDVTLVMLRRAAASK
ncbi:MAG TPA: SpoIIE family protein phosphatase, partial [Candidatus Krumholzibacteria bacterium]|nr:SpoIIE family protein phosphatase [Candidatus Krumholzibacteria bacterium]